VPAPILIIQTTYAELLERCAAASFAEAFPENGTFTSKDIKGRRYWYFQTATSRGRAQRYVGPESPELLSRIASHKKARDDERERRALVSTLTRSFGLPAPISRIGDILLALEKAGVFRLDSVLVGTVAYQTYSAMLGIRLSSALIQTSDIDIAQFTDVAIAVGETTSPMLQVLKSVDDSFREIPHLAGHELATSYQAAGGLRVDFLTPNLGADTDTPRRLHTLQTNAQPLRFLDFLIAEPERAVVLHGPGIYVRVPTPERYAVHKLIISVRRSVAVGKRAKDLQQAQVLIETLTEKRPKELKLVWEEAFARGPKWRSLLLEALSQLSGRARDLLLKVLDSPRKIVPGLDLAFNNPPARYDFERDLVAFEGEALGSRVACAVSREALEDHFGANGLDRRGRLEAFQKNRSTIEGLLRAKYLTRPVEEVEAVLLRTLDVEKLRQEVPKGTSTRARKDRAHE
jgi:hypothetical protein